MKYLKIKDLSLHRLFLKFHLNGDLSSEDFILFDSFEIFQILYDEAEQLIQKQSDCLLWYEFQYGKITVSKLYEAAHCRIDSGSFVKQITGVNKMHETNAMLRAEDLEKLMLIKKKAQI